MTRLFRDRKRYSAIGLQALYIYVALSFVNNQKKFTDELLRSKGNYEIQRLQF
jgi:hypothetical protein